MVDQTVPTIQTSDRQLAGIGGWLILAAIGLIIGLVLGVLQLVSGFVMYSDVADAGFGREYSIELTLTAGLLALLVYSTILFFGQRRDAPSVFIILMVAAVVVQGALFAIELSTEAEILALDTVKELVRSVVSAAIWIPYFLVSKRVKATFTK